LALRKGSGGGLLRQHLAKWREIWGLAKERESNGKGFLLRKSSRVEFPMGKTLYASLGGKG